MDFRRGDRTRTCDSLVPNQERYQLRYTPNSFGYVVSDESRGDRTRTCDSLVPNQERYQLRYTPKNIG